MDNCPSRTAELLTTSQSVMRSTESYNGRWIWPTDVLVACRNSSERDVKLGPTATTRNGVSGEIFATGEVRSRHHNIQGESFGSDLVDEDRAGQLWKTSKLDEILILKTRSNPWCNRVWLGWQELRCQREDRGPETYALGMSIRHSTDAIEVLHRATRMD